MVGVGVGVVVAVAVRVAIGVLVALGVRVEVLVGAAALVATMASKRRFSPLLFCWSFMRTIEITAKIQAKTNASLVILYLKKIRMVLVTNKMKFSPHTALNIVSVNMEGATGTKISISISKTSSTQPIWLPFPILWAGELSCCTGCCNITIRLVFLWTLDLLHDTTLDDGTKRWPCRLPLLFLSPVYGIQLRLVEVGHRQQALPSRQQHHGRRY